MDKMPGQRALGKTPLNASVLLSKANAYESSDLTFK